MLTAASYLIPYPFFFFGEEIRVTIDRINGIQAALEAAERAGAPPFILEIYREILRQLEAAYRENRGRTGPIPACSLQMFGNQPARDAQGNLLAYTKPLIVLIDDFSISAGDIFPTMLQDNQRGPLVGTRTNGAGGSVSGWPAGIYSESMTSNTNSLVDADCAGHDSGLSDDALHRECRRARGHPAGLHDAREPAYSRGALCRGVHARTRRPGPRPLLRDRLAPQR